MTKGFCIWFSGIPSAGKSTLANALKQRLDKDFGLPSTILDGDEVRQNITKGLGFSNEDRLENVKRVAWMASRIVEAGGIALVALVSPSSMARQAAREIIGKDRVYTIHVDCSLQEVIDRDVKGLYAKAISGEIEGLTGYDAKYEAPVNKHLKVDTETNTIKGATDFIVDFLVDDLKWLPSGKTALFIGRWTPFHNGHKYIIDKALTEGKQVSIAVRCSKEKFSVKERIEMIQAVYPEAFVFPIVDIESVNIGRLVGYEVNRYDVPENIHGISATEIRDLMSKGDNSWKEKVPKEVANFLS